MGLGGIVSSAIETARLVHEELEVSVTHRAWLSQGDGTSGAVLGDPVIRKALVQEGNKQLRTSGGRVVTVRTILTFLPETEGAAPPEIGMLDSLVLPDGRTGTILEIPDTPTNADGVPFTRIVWLG